MNVLNISIGMINTYYLTSFLEVWEFKPVFNLNELSQVWLFILIKSKVWIIQIRWKYSYFWICAIFNNSILSGRNGHLFFPLTIFLSSSQHYWVLMLYLFRNLFVITLTDDIAWHWQIYSIKMTKKSIVLLTRRHCL